MKTYIQPAVKVTEINAVTMICSSNEGSTLDGILDGTTSAQGSKVRAWEVLGEEEEL